MASRGDTTAARHEEYSVPVMTTTKAIRKASSAGTGVRRNGTANAGAAPAPPRNTPAMP